MTKMVKEVREMKKIKIKDQGSLGSSTAIAISTLAEYQRDRPLEQEKVEIYRKERDK